MSLRHTLTALASATILAACGSAPLGKAPARDFNTLSKAELKGFDACTVQTLQTLKPQRVVKAVNELVTTTPEARSLFTQKETAVTMLAAISTSLARQDCAEQMNIRQETVPAVEVHIFVEQPDAPLHRRTPQQYSI